MKKLITLIALLALLTPLTSAAQMRATDMLEPRPVPIPQAVNRDAAKQAVMNATRRRGWTVGAEDDAAGLIVADLHVRRHWARINIDYADGEVRMAYVDSSNLHYDRRDGRTIIHKNYNNWLEYLANDIRVELNYAR